MSRNVGTALLSSDVVPERWMLTTLLWNCICGLVQLWCQIMWRLNCCSEFVHFFCLMPCGLDMAWAKACTTWSGAFFVPYKLWPFWLCHVCSDILSLFVCLHAQCCVLLFSERKLLCTVYAAKDQILSFYTSIPLEYVDIDMSVCAQWWISRSAVSVLYLRNNTWLDCCISVELMSDTGTRCLKSVFWVSSRFYMSNLSGRLTLCDKCRAKRHMTQQWLLYFTMSLQLLLNLRFVRVWSDLRCCKLQSVQLPIVLEI